MLIELTTAHGEKFICKLYSFYKKIYYFFIVVLGDTRNVGFLLLKIVIFMIF